MLTFSQPIFSAPFSASLAWFGWSYPSSYEVQGFSFGIWGGCRLANTPALRGCTYKTWGCTASNVDGR